MKCYCKSILEQGKVKYDTILLFIVLCAQLDDELTNVQVHLVFDKLRRIVLYLVCVDKRSEEKIKNNTGKKKRKLNARGS